MRQSFNPKKLMEQGSNFDQIASNLSNFVSHDPLYQSLLNVKLQTGVQCNNINTNVNVTFKLAKKLSFGQNWQFGSNLAQDYATIYLMI